MPWCALSPAELLMGRRIRTDIPQVTGSFIPKWSHIKNFRILDEKYKKSQKEYYDKRHRVRELPPLPENQPVWVSTRGDMTPARILHASDTPRSYVVETSSGQLRRNVHIWEFILLHKRLLSLLNPLPSPTDQLPLFTDWNCHRSLIDWHTNIKEMWQRLVILYCVFILVVTSYMYAVLYLE